MKLLTIRTILLCNIVLLTGCTSTGPKPPSTNQSLANWNQYQSDLGTYFNGIIGRSNNMRVVPATIIYPIGTVVRRDSMSMLSRKCSFNSTFIPISFAGPSVPEITATQNMKFVIDPGSWISKGIEEIESLNLKYDNTSVLTAKIGDVHTVQLAEDEVLGVIQEPECLDAVENKDISVIRGYITARYEVSAGGGVDTGAKIQAFKSELLDISYQDKNKFEVKDKKVSEKFVILADGRAEKHIVLSGNFLQSLEDGNGCKETSVITFSPSNNDDLDYLISKGDYRSQDDFSSCNELETYLKTKCTTPESYNKCISALMKNE